MKKLLVFPFIFLIVFANCQTSVYHPFPDSNAVWNIEFGVPCFPVFYFKENYSIFLSGDTLINSQSYHKLFIPTVVKSVDTNICGGVSIGYKGAIRQDTSIKKVFIIQPYDSLESLLYDFNMQVGDTILGITNTFFSDKDTVQSIDSVLVGNSYRKKWNIINQNINYCFIEGIGSTYGLIAQSPGNAIGTFPIYALNCFSLNGTALFPDTVSNCQLITHFNSSDKISIPLSIFPNPSEGSFTIDFGESEFKEINLTDLSGKIIFRNREFNQSKIKISGLENGTYILTLLDKNKMTINRRIIVCPK